MRIYKNPLDKRGFYPIIRQTDRQTDRQDKSVLFCCVKLHNNAINAGALRPRFSRGCGAPFCVPSERGRLRVQH